MIKAFFSDLDGTLLDNVAVFGEGLSVKNIQALKDLSNSGVKVVLASGRNYEFAEVYINQEYGFNFDLIGSNGGIIKYNGEIVEQHLADKSKLLELTNTLLNENIVNTFLVTSDYQHHFLNVEEEVYKYFLDSYKKGYIGYVSNESYLDKLMNNDFPTPLKMVIRTEGYESSEKLIKRLNAQFKDDFDFYGSTDVYIEVMPKGINKGKAVESLCKLYGINLDECAVIGDAQNDIYMFEKTKHSYVMSHSKNSVKEYANNITEDVASVIYKIIEENNNENNNT